MGKYTERDIKIQLDKVIARGWLPTFQQQAQRMGSTTSHLLGLASRETNIENIRGDFRNGIYHGAGVLQVDIGTNPDYVKNWTRDNYKPSIEHGVNIYLGKKKDILRMRGKVMTVKGTKFEVRMGHDVSRRKIATAAYNCGWHAIKNFSLNRNIDRNTTGRDYSTDVYKRCIIFAKYLSESGIEPEALDIEIERQGKYYIPQNNNMNIVPKRRPNFKQQSFEKTAEYFLGKDWQTRHPLVIIGVRQSRINFYDDDCAVYANGKYETYNFNTEPARYIIRGRAKAVLKKGVHDYTLSYHKKWNNSRRYVALNPANSERKLPVWRKSGSGWLSSIGIAINIHRGGNRNTYSEGCQTLPPNQYNSFLRMMGIGLGISVPVGNVRKPSRKYTDGVGKFPYILIDQNDFEYIMDLSADDFDNAEDLKYQLKNFVNLPKYGQERPQYEKQEEVNVVNGVIEEENAEVLESDMTERSLVADIDDNAEESYISDYIPTSASEIKEGIDNLTGSASQVTNTVNTVVDGVDDTTNTYNRAKGAYQAVAGGGPGEEGNVVVQKGQSWKSLIKIYLKEVLAFVLTVLGLAWENIYYIGFAVIIFAIVAYLYTKSKERADTREMYTKKNLSNPDEINVTEISNKEMKKREKQIKEESVSKGLSII